MSLTRHRQSSTLDARADKIGAAELGPQRDASVMTPYRPRHNSVFKLQLHKVLEHTPMNYLAKQWIQDIAAMADPAYGCMLQVRSRGIEEALPQRPPMHEWLELYRNPQKLFTGTADAFPVIKGESGYGTLRAIAELRRLGRYVQEDPGASLRLLKRAAKHKSLKREFAASAREARIKYKVHLRRLKSDIQGAVMSNSEREHFDKQIASNPAIYFYLRVVLPCMMTYQATPKALCLALDDAKNQTERAEAAEKLVRLDGHGIYLPAIQTWMNDSSGATRQEREALARRWWGQGLQQKQFKRTAFKASLGSLIHRPWWDPLVPR